MLKGKQTAMTMGGVDEVFGLFPTPLLRAPGTLSAHLVDGLVQHFSALALNGNKASDDLSHTEMLRPDDSPLLVEAATLITPKIVDMGVLMFGQRLGWAIKEMWVNVLNTGGHQAVHNHANSFISGVVYLTTTHPASQTVFMKSAGGTEFVFKNEHANITPTAFNSDRWVSPAPAPGDLVLFPSYVLHAVPPNQGERRITLSFNAIPGRLDAWGYAIKFSA
jgi:Putative 2OG-Fe(II) oxygenase